MISICLTDPNGLVDSKDLDACAKALTVQVNRDFSPHWNCGTVVVYCSPAPRAGDWVLSLDKKESAPQGALGYHTVTDDGCPVLHIYPELDKEDGADWQVTASHEALEALADPWLRASFMTNDGKIIAAEVCDGVEADSYKIDDVPVSNFALPSYFAPPPSGAGPFDFMGLCTEPGETREGGYNQYYDTDKKKWSMIQAQGVRSYRQKPGQRAR
jgi:hypothetical protein